MPRKPKADKALERARERGLREALEQERMALAAIVKVMLLEVDDPKRVLARIDSMVRAAEGNRRVPPATRRSLIDAARFVRRAVQREQGQQQTLLDPPKPEPKPERIDALVTATDGPQQLGLVDNEQIGGDAEQAHAERVATLGVIHAKLIDILREHGAASDAELHHRYLLAGALASDGAHPFQTKSAIAERRRELVAAGRLTGAERDPASGAARWDVIERKILEASA